MAQESSQQWNPIQVGDIIDIVAPASGCHPDELKAGVKAIEAWGFQARVPKDILKRSSPIFSNTDEKRFAHLKTAFEAKDSSVIWCLRGGYGSIRLLPQLEKMREPAKVKYLVGFSDITSLHSFVQSKWGWPSLHGPLVDRLGGSRISKAELHELYRLMTGQQTDVVYKNLKSLNVKAKKLKTLSSTLTGGNLCVLTSSLGTPWGPGFKNKFLFLEEIGEKPHRFDRFLIQLSQSGALKGCKGILFGNILNETKVQTQMIWKRVISEFAEHAKIPVFKGLPVGHGSKQKPLPFGAKAVLQRSTASRHQLTVSTGARV